MIGRLLVLLICCVSGCKQGDSGTQKRAEVSDQFIVGDDIFEAEKILVAKGFKIKSGPSFATVNKDYYLLIVDYGESPNSLETFKYTVGIPSKSGPITGIIKAGIDGKITSIE